MTDHLPNNGRRVAVIGAGAAGLAAAKYLLAEGLLVTIFERKAEPGGVWNTKTTNGCDQSPVYDGLETKVPRSLMTFSDHPWPKDKSLFPLSSEVCKYLESYAAKLVQSPLARSNLTVKCNTEVNEVKQGTSMSRQCCRVGFTEHHFPKDISLTECFDAVVVAIGNYHHFQVPPLDGVTEWDRLYPNSLSHSMGYRRPVDFAEQLSAETHVGVTGVQRFNYEKKTATFKNGAELPVDRVVFCTGYTYDFSFIKKAGNELIFPAGVSVRNVYKHVFYTENPSLAFVGLPTMSAACTVAEAQNAVVARVFSARLSLPTRPELGKWYDESTEAHDELVRSGKADIRHYHSFRLREGKQYVNELLEWSLGTAGYHTIYGDDGMRPPFWCACLDRARETSKELRKNFIQLGQARHLVNNHQALGSRHDGPCAQGRNMMRRTGRRCRACYLYR